MRPRRLLVLCLLAVAGTAAGCGGDAEAKNAYVDDVQVAQRAFVSRFDQVRGRLTATSTIAQDRRTLTDFAGAARRFTTELREITPPEAVRQEHAGLMAAVDETTRGLEAAAARLRDGSARARARVRTELSSGIEAGQERIVAAIAAINTALRE